MISNPHNKTANKIISALENFKEDKEIHYIIGIQTSQDEYKTYNLETEIARKIIDPILWNRKSSATFVTFNKTCQIHYKNLTHNKIADMDLDSKMQEEQGSEHFENFLSSNLDNSSLDTKVILIGNSFVDIKDVDLIDLLEKQSNKILFITTNSSSIVELSNSKIFEPLAIESIIVLDYISSRINQILNFNNQLRVMGVSSNSAILRFNITSGELDEIEEYAVAAKLVGSDDWSEPKKSRWPEVDLSDLKTDSIYTLRYRVHYKDSDDIWSKWNYGDIDGGIQFKTKKKLLSDEPVADQVQKFIKKFKEIKITSRMKVGGIKKLNFLLFGRIGAGKSALASTIYSTFQKDYVKIFEDGSSDKSYTRELKKKDVENSHFTLGDIFGLEEDLANDSFKEKLLDLLDGKIQNKFTLDEYKNATIFKKNMGNAVHGVIVVYDHNWASNQAYNRLYDTFLELILKKNIPVIGFITKIDDVGLNSSSEIFTNPEASNRFEAARKIFENSIKTGNLFPIYSCFDKRDQFIELILLKAIDQLTTASLDFIKQQLNLVDIIFKKNNEDLYMGTIQFDSISDRLHEFKSKIASRVNMEEKDFQFLSKDQKKLIKANDEVNYDIGQVFLKVQQEIRGRINLQAGNNEKEEILKIFIAKELPKKVEASGSDIIFVKVDNGPDKELMFEKINTGISCKQMREKLVDKYPRYSKFVFLDTYKAVVNQEEKVNLRDIISQPSAKSKSFIQIDLKNVQNIKVIDLSPPTPEQEEEYKNDDPNSAPKESSFEINKICICDSLLEIRKQIKAQTSLEKYIFLEWFNDKTYNIPKFREDTDPLYKYITKEKEKIVIFIKSIDFDNY